MNIDKIGCIVVCQATVMPDQYLGIKCAKGRGRILPGGKWDPEDNNESYKDAAAREFSEELGIQISTSFLKYIWHGPDGFGYTTFAFKYTGPLLTLSDCVESTEGKPCLITEEQLYASQYNAYYRLLFEVMKK